MYIYLYKNCIDLYKNCINNLKKYLLYNKWNVNFVKKY